MQKASGLNEMSIDAEFVSSIVFNSQTYFSTNELGCRCDVCQGRGKLADGFAESLLGLRLVLGFALPVSSCCRCLAHNTDSKGSSGSYHIYQTPVGTCAVDVPLALYDSVKRGQIAKKALLLGWRVGVNRNFLHLDRAPFYYPGEESKMFLY